MKDDERKLQIFTSVFIRLQLEPQDYKIIFLDEFTFASDSTTFFNWSKKGEKAFLYYTLNKFKMSFILAFSKENIEGIVGNEGTNWSQHIKSFLIQLTKNNTKNTIFIMENCSIHKANIINELWIKLNLWILTIPAYSPFLNPCEKLIQKIKSSIRSHQSQQKLISLPTIKAIVDKISPKTLQNCVTESYEETLQILNNLY